MFNKEEDDYLAVFLYSDKEDDYGKRRPFTPLLCMRCKKETFTIAALIKHFEAYKKVDIYHSNPYKALRCI